MKKVLTTLAATAMALALTGNAYARNCAAEAQAAVDAQTHPVGSLALGCAVGAGLGSLFSNGQAGAIAGGCLAGGAGGAILSAEKQKQIYNTAYAACTNGQQAYTTSPAPSGSAITTKKANVRSGPSTSYSVNETLAANTTVSVGVCTNTGWCQVGGYSGPGWMSASLLTFQ
jgi:hypothetical protein